MVFTCRLKVKTGVKKKSTSQCNGLNKLTGNLCTNQKTCGRILYIYMCVLGPKTRRERSLIKAFSVDVKIGVTVNIE